MFANRSEAGILLGQKLIESKPLAPIILALPRGGVVVGYEVAKILHAPLEVIIARKIGAPNQPELGLGAICENDTEYLDELSISALGVKNKEVQSVVELEKKELKRRVSLYRHNRPLPGLANKTALLVDDGLATGVTAKAAIMTVRKNHPARVILAVPVIPEDMVVAFKNEVDDLVYLLAPENLGAIGYFYQDFHQITDEEVVGILEKARAGS